MKPNDKLDVDFMQAAVRTQRYWWFVAPRMSGWEPKKLEEPQEPEQAAAAA